MGVIIISHQFKNLYWHLTFLHVLSDDAYMQV